jgi:hypothetical protein
LITRNNQVVICLLIQCPHLWRFPILAPPPKLMKAWVRKLRTSCVDMCKNSFSFLIWETSSKAPLQDLLPVLLCSPSFCFLSFYFCVFLVFFSSFYFYFYFLFVICTYHEYTHPMVFLHTNGYPNLSLSRIPISLFEKA